MPYVEFLIPVLLTALFCRYLLVVFFDTPSPAQWVNLIKRHKMGDEKFLFTRDDFDNYVFYNWSYFFRSLVGCPYCLMAHLTFWVSLALAFTPLFGWSLLVPFWLSVLGTTAFLFPKGPKEDPVIETPKPPKKRPQTNVPVDEEGNTPLTIRRLGVTLTREPGSQTYRMTHQDPERELILRVLKEETLAPFPQIAEVQTNYKRELEELKERNPTCPPCEQNALMNKYYEILRQRISHANPYHSTEVPGSGSSSTQ
jgi:hypothetical protein